MRIKIVIIYIIRTGIYVNPWVRVDIYIYVSLSSVLHMFIYTYTSMQLHIQMCMSFCMYTLFQKKFPIVCDQFESHQQKSIRGYSSTLLENNFDWSGFQNWIYFYTLVQWGKLWRILIRFIHLVNSVCMIVSLRK